MSQNVVRLCADLYFHFFFGLLLMLVGLLAIGSQALARWYPKVEEWHPYIGRFWFYGMIVQLYTSIWARKDGMRWFIFVFGVVCYGSLIIGHLAIRVYQGRKNKYKSLSESPTNSTTSLGVHNKQHKRSKTFKYIHAVFMVLSYVMLFGAGSAFIKRYMDVRECHNIYMPHS